ncbi:DNA (cytosine-5-)-methyltransferase [Dehalobacter sp. DCM]|uniref:DNA cytosine methyltransferase n=1 Tax=Dehalobacter sp. DCM TaxID=2907827 RepID=UPI0030815491|nr:DNA (cytosine-5-)-methyltransferase [Dehalobacter sp. DCM]
MQTTFIDFFAGIGGFRAGLEACGMKCIGHCEIDKYADKSYRAIFDVKEDEWFARDITKIEPGDVPCAHLWTAGFPCQDISVAGSRRGLDGERSGLFFEIVRLIKGKAAEDRPQWVILENVKNLFSVHNGWDFTTVLFEMAALGYDLQYGLVNSRDFGVPQNRERVYIVAHRHTGDGCTGRIFPLPSGNGKALIQIIGGMQGRRVYCPEGISATLTAQGGGGGSKTGLYCMGLGVHRIDGIKEGLELAHAITAGDYRGLDRNQTQNAVLEGCETCLQAEDKNDCPFCFIDLNKNPKLTDIARCIKAHYNVGVTNRGADNSGVLHLCRRVGRGLAQTLETSCNQGIILACGRIRRLTPRECWRFI